MLCLGAGADSPESTAPANFNAVSRFFGDSIRGTAETDVASVGLGMAMGTTKRRV